jgi:hypothetical protein
LLVCGGVLSLIGGRVSHQFGNLLRAARANDQQLIFIESADVAEKVHHELAGMEAAAALA